MNCVLFAKMDQVFSKENKTLKKYLENWKKYWKSQGKVREFCHSGKVGTLDTSDAALIESNGVAQKWVATPLFSMRTEPLASLHSCHSVDAGAWCKRALNQ